MKNCIDLIASENNLQDFFSSYNHFRYITHSTTESKILKEVYDSKKINKQNDDIYGIDPKNYIIYDIISINQTMIKNFSEKKEMELLKRLFAGNYDNIIVSTAYMRFPKEYIALLDKKNVLIFVPSEGSTTLNCDSIKGKILNLLYEYSIYQTVKKMKNARIYRFYKKNYNFHKKGIWFIKNDKILTFCGSSNYNYRSNYRDKELNHLIYSNNKNFYNEMMKEIEFLKINSKLIIKNQWRKIFYIIAIIVFFVWKIYVK